jgi:hypothetical protein
MTDPSGSPTAAAVPLPVAEVSHKWALAYVSAHSPQRSGKVGADWECGCGHGSLGSGIVAAHHSLRSGKGLWIGGKGWGICRHERSARFCRIQGRERAIPLTSRSA